MDTHVSVLRRGTTACLGAVLVFALGSVASATPDAICFSEHPLAPTGGDGQGFGNAVAVDGDTAVICSSFEAYVHVWTGSAWTQEDILGVPGALEGFGYSAAVQGDRAVIGSPFEDSFAGNVYVFVRSGSTWSLEDTLTGTDTGASDHFGIAVDIDGDRILVGAYRDTPSGADSGSAYVFERSGSTWSETAKIVPADGDVEDFFGWDVALDGSTALIGAYGDDRVYSYTESAGTWSLEDAIENPVGRFGTSLDIDGDRAVIGALGSPANPVASAHVYERSGGTWSHVTELPHPGLPFGFSAALDGDTALLGANSCLIAGIAAYAYREDGGSWSLAATLEVPNGEGNPVGLSGSRAIVGGKPAFFCGAGSASVFELSSVPAPSVAFRNAGTNPASLSTDSASIGETLEFTVDLTTTGHSMALVIGFDSPFGLTLGGGQTLLCFDLLGSGGELINTGFGAGPIATLSVAVPNEPALIGFFVATQAIHAFGVTPFALSNAQDIVIGGCP